MASPSNSYRWRNLSSTPVNPSLADKAAIPPRAYDLELTYPHQHSHSSSLEDYLFSYQNALTAPYSSNNSSRSSDTNAAFPACDNDNLTNLPKTRSPSNVPQDILPDFESLRGNYLRMLANEVDDNSPVDNTTRPIAELHTGDNGEDPQLSAYDSISTQNDCSHSLLPDLIYFSVASEFLREEQFTDYLSSPLGASPTLDDSPSSSLHSPIKNSVEFNNFGSMNADSHINTIQPVKDSPNPAVLMGSHPIKDPDPAVAVSSNKSATLTYNAGSSYRNRSLHPTQRLPSSQANNIMVATSSSRKASSSFTPSKASNGTATRPRVILDNLIPLDAPTRPRPHIIIPSETTTAENNSKRSHAVAFEGDDINEAHNHKDEQGIEEESLSSSEIPSEGPPGPHATESEKLAYKRRRCTLAARRSRRRKLEYQLSLEVKIEKLENQREMWRTRCDILQEILKSRNADFKFEEEE
ncbi:hypothetical protein DFJ43DRAFT_1100002 [Lentinula guzmanii]|uniref:BZIP domain-containing protein n=1 Tax=Lentinula guzmanii TaxID=2804957 RepID=A0AA38J3F8_9AGAR|nr:hypothetical protein DFJ43DRAFT_1100002 [Lentinula guzmanii]